MTDLPASTAPAAAAHPLVKGRCPACNGASLFLGSGGYVTCSRLDCPNPTAADEILHREHTPANELARLHEGEETTEGHDPAVVHTDGQWLYRFLRATPAERLQVINALRANAAQGSDCFLMGHKQRLADDRHAWSVLARVREVRDRWLLMTLEPGQVRRLLDDLTAALRTPEQTATEATGSAASDVVRKSFASFWTGVPAREHCGELQPELIGSLPRTECVLRPGHSGSHADDRGCRWWHDPTAADEPARTAPNNEPPPVAS